MLSDLMESTSERCFRSGSLSKVIIPLLRADKNLLIIVYNQSAQEIIGVSSKNSNVYLFIHFYRPHSGGLNRGRGRARVGVGMDEGAHTSSNCPSPKPRPHPGLLGSRWNVTQQSVRLLWSRRRTVLFILCCNSVNNVNLRTCSQVFHRLGIDSRYHN